MNREIIKIDEEKCDGCGLCVPNCHEGALQIIDDKAVLVSELMCDGLGACLGHCPQGALTIERREARPYDEEAVMQEMIGKGRNVVVAHMKHLKDHREDLLLKQGILYLINNKEKLDFNPVEVIQQVHNHGKPRSLTRERHEPEVARNHGMTGEGAFQGPATGILVDSEGMDTETACSCPGSREMTFGPGNQQGKGMESGGTPVSRMQLVQSAAEQAGRKIPVKFIEVGIQGEIKAEEWV
jgi:NAD-dependent dihydropyrimidine dehydrogenase PreA subunit